MAVNPEEAEAPNVEANKLSLTLFRRPEKFKIGENFDLFIKKSNLYFEAVELEDVKKRRLGFLFNLSEDAFRLAEPVEFGEGENAYKEWIKKLKTLLEKNQTATERGYNFHRREQEPGESVDSYAVSLREAGAKFGFHGDEYSSKLVDQFILELRDKATQNKLLQEPPNSLDDALLIARRFEAANATKKTLAREAVEKLNKVAIGSVNSLNAAKTCYSCNGSRQCPTRIVPYIQFDSKIEFDLEHLSGEEREKMENLLNGHQDVFAKSSSELGLTTLVEHKIETGGAVPVKQPPRRMPNSLRTVLEDQVGEMLENNIIKPSNSPWSSSIVLVRKKDGTWRFCIDFRKLNDVTVKDAFPLPQVADLMDNLAGHQYFSTLDLANGILAGSRRQIQSGKTAFVIPGGGHFEFFRMPFGLTNAVPPFQRLMLAVLNGLLPLKCLEYLQ